MTPDELQALDRMLAEKAMGWHMEGIAWYDDVTRVPYWTHAPSYWKHPEKITIWHPTTDIAQAFMVAESKSLGEWNWHFHQQDDGKWAAELREGYNTSYGRVHYTKADTLALALCLAAQAWLERGGDAK